MVPRHSQGLGLGLGLASASAKAKVRARVRVVRRRHRLYRGCVDADAYGEGRGRVTRGLDDAAEEGERHEQRGA